MKWMFVFLLLLSFGVQAQVSTTLSASIVAAQEFDPQLFEQIKNRLSSIQKTCAEVPAMIAKSKDAGVRLQTVRSHAQEKAYLERIQSDLSRAIENEIQKIDKNINLEKTCLNVIFELSLGKHAEMEGLTYLRTVQKHVEAGEYQQCSDKLSALLKEAGDEN